MRRSRRGPSRRRRLALGFVGGGLLLVGPAVSHAGAPSSPPKFCDARIVHDYAKPFERMPAEHPPPRGELPFGPRNLSMYYANFGTRILRDDDRVGYWFAAKEAGTRTLRLNWDVSAALWRVDARGADLARAGAIHRRIAEVEGPESFEENLDFTFPPQRVGVYLFDLSFRTLSGRKLRDYSEYFRVVPRRFGARLVTGRSSYRPGEFAYVQARNYGSADLTVPNRIPVQRREGSTWVPVSEPSTSITQRVPWLLGIGEAPPCSRFHIPAGAEAGRYRFRTPVRVAGSRHERVLEAEFRVAGYPARS